MFSSIYIRDLRLPPPPLPIRFVQFVMVQLTVEHRTFLVENFFETGSLKVTGKRLKMKLMR